MPVWSWAKTRPNRGPQPDHGYILFLFSSPWLEFAYGRAFVLLGEAAVTCLCWTLGRSAHLWATATCPNAASAPFPSVMESGRSSKNLIRGCRNLLGSSSHSGQHRISSTSPRPYYPSSKPCILNPRFSSKYQLKKDAGFRVPPSSSLANRWLRSSSIWRVPSRRWGSALESRRQKCPLWS